MIADDPRLDVRIEAPRQPVRVVLDRRRRGAQVGAYSRAAGRGAPVRIDHRGPQGGARPTSGWAMRASSEPRVTRSHLDLARGARAPGGARGERRAGGSRVRACRAPCSPRASSTNGCCTSRPNYWARTRNRLRRSARLTSLEAAPEFVLIDSKPVGPDLRLRLQPTQESKIDVHRHRPGDRRHHAAAMRAPGAARRVKTGASRWNSAPSRATVSISATASASMASASPSRRSTPSSLQADVSGETLRVTTLGAKPTGCARESRARACAPATASAATGCPATSTASPKS